MPVAHGTSLFTDDRYGDLDGDGYPNLAEFIKGTSASSDTSVPTADRVGGPGQTYSTVAAALSSLTAEDQIIMVKPGIYSGVINNNTGSSKRLFLISEAVNPNLTRLDWAADVIESNKDIYVRGFTITGSGSTSAALWLPTGGGVHCIEHCILKVNGYGIFSNISSVANRIAVNNVQVIDSTKNAFYGTGVNHWKLAHVTTSGCTATSSSGNGAAVFLTSATGGSFTAINSVFWNSNTGTEISISGLTPSVTYSCVRGVSFSRFGSWSIEFRF